MGPILENLPTDLDNFSIKNVWDYEDIDTFMEKIMEKVVNGDTARVTIAEVDKRYTRNIIENIVKMKPSPVRVEKRDTKPIQEHYYDIVSRSGNNLFMCEIVISL